MGWRTRGLIEIRKRKVLKSRWKGEDGLQRMTSAKCPFFFLP